MTAQPKPDKKEDPLIRLHQAHLTPADKPTGLVASFSPLTGTWQPNENWKGEIPAVLEDMFLGQLHGNDVPKPFHVTHPFAIKLADGNWWGREGQPVQRNALKDEQPTAIKPARHTLAQIWRDAYLPWRDACPSSTASSGEGPRMRATNQPVLMLTAGEPAPLLLTAGDAIPMQTMLEKLARFEDDSISQQIAYAEAREEYATLMTLPTGPRTAGTLYPKQKSGPLGKAAAHKELMRNNSTAFALARTICNHGETPAYLARFGIHSGTPVTAEQLEAISKAVTTEQLKYVSPVTLATLNAWGKAIYGDMVWNTTAATGSRKYSDRRTEFIARLYETEAEAWIDDLKKKAGPAQLIDAGRRIEVEKQKALCFGANVSSGRLQ